MQLVVTTAQFAPVFWSMVALIVVSVAVILASIDPEMTEAYLGNPSWLIASVAVALVVLTIAALEVDASVRTVLSN